MMMKILSDWEQHFALQTSNFCTNFTQPRRSAWCIIIVGVVILIVFVFIFNCTIDFCFGSDPNHQTDHMPNQHQNDKIFIYDNLVYHHNTQAALGRMLAKNTQQLLDCAQVKYNNNIFFLLLLNFLFALHLLHLWLKTSFVCHSLPIFLDYSFKICESFFSAAAPGCPLCKWVLEQD